ncbi:MAG TPA: HlyC/CorC family transporter [Rhizomicrobium sp.]|nr:HlyC/CorC family transporter [Rhizomicrobium sp.]
MISSIVAAGCIVVLLLLSGFFSGSETALTAVSRGLMHQLEKEGSRRARDVNTLLGDREGLIGAILLGNTFINILITSLATSLLQATFGARTVVITTIAMTVLILVFAEVLPKTLAIARTDRFALNAAYVLRPIVSVLTPLVETVQFVVWGVLALFGVRESKKPEAILPPHEDIRGTVALHHIEGAVEREHRDMIGGILNLHELTVGDTMTHRKNMAVIDANLPVGQLLDAIIAADHTRVPVWSDTPENIIGVLNTKDIVRELVRRRGKISDLDIRSLLTQPWFVPETTSLEEQLAVFRQRRSHFALVVDEYGALQGLITLGDILEEIFGDIPDEYAKAEKAGVRPQPDGSFIVEGTLPIRELNRELDWNLPDDEATTIAGLVIHEARAIPDVGQRFAFHGYTFEITRRHRNQIMTLRVTPPAGPPAEQVAHRQS